MSGVDELADELLFERYRRGDAEAFEQLYRRYRQNLYRYLLHSAASRAEAEEIYQEVWARIIAARERIGTGPGQSLADGGFRAYLFRAARNLQIDISRRNRLLLVSDEGDIDATPGAGPDVATRRHQEDCAERMRQELGDLPAEQREAFLLKEESDLSLEQIASLAAVGRETIKSRLRYALKRLREALEDCL